MNSSLMPGLGATVSTSFAEIVAVSAWVQHLGGLERLRGFQEEGRSEFVRAASEPLPPAPPLTVPRILAHDEAPSYIDQTPPEIRGFLAWMPYDMGEPRIIAQDLDLVSALMFLTQADTDREYAIERAASGRYMIISGERDRVLSAGDQVLHTHQDGIALPSECDLDRMEVMAERGERHWSMIYSAPPHEHQLAFIRRLLPRSFEISFWRDRLDRERGERRTSARNFLVRTDHDPALYDQECEVSSLEVKERSLQGRTIGSWNYGPETHPDRNIQNFWRDLLR